MWVYSFVPPFCRDRYKLTPRENHVKSARCMLCCEHSSLWLESNHTLNNAISVYHFCAVGKILFVWLLFTFFREWRVSRIDQNKCPELSTFSSLKMLHDLQCYWMLWLCNISSMIHLRLSAGDDCFSPLEAAVISVLVYLACFLQNHVASWISTKADKINSRWQLAFSLIFLVHLKRNGSD